MKIFISELRIYPHNCSLLLLACAGGRLELEAKQLNSTVWFCLLTFKLLTFFTFAFALTLRANSTIVSEMAEEKAAAAALEETTSEVAPLVPETVKDVEEEKAAIVPAPEEKPDVSKPLADVLSKIFSQKKKQFFFRFPPLFPRFTFTFLSVYLGFSHEPLPI